jgi:hypothetical protein
MARKDYYHDLVRNALQNDGWLITNDPFTVPTPDMDFYIDLGAEKSIIGAERDGEQIAVEIKSLRGSTYYYDAYQALGQFLIYRLAMDKQKMLRDLYLAVPNIAFQELEKVSIFKDAWLHYHVHLLIFDEKEEKILQWIKH